MCKTPHDCPTLSIKSKHPYIPSKMQPLPPPLTSSSASLPLLPSSAPPTVVLPDPQFAKLALTSELLSLLFSLPEMLSYPDLRMVGSSLCFKSELKRPLLGKTLPDHHHHHPPVLQRACFVICFPPLRVSHPSLQSVGTPKAPSTLLSPLFLTPVASEP